LLNHVYGPGSHDRDVFLWWRTQDTYSDLDHLHVHLALVGPVIHKRRDRGAQDRPDDAGDAYPNGSARSCFDHLMISPSNSILARADEFVLRQLRAGGRGGTLADLGLSIVFGLRRPRDVVGGILERDELASARQRDRVFERF